ncbi:MAG TPA: VOC family protein [Dehalococcoidia bacterium]|jgi:uncharacterized glyoxalase superfamily protein PhnB
MSSTATVTANIFPFICYEDAPAAIDWLCRAFGFERLQVVPGESGEIVHAELQLGPGVVMISSATPSAAERLRMKSTRALGATSQGIAIFVEDVDTRWERALAAGAEVVLPIYDAHYGARTFTVRDPEGNLWSVGNYLPHA